MTVVPGFVVALGVVGLLVLLLRWTFSRGHSLVARAPRIGAPDDYGMLVACARPRSMAEGEELRRRLAASGVRSTLALTTEGTRLFVWPDDERRARDLLAAR